MGWMAAGLLAAVLATPAFAQQAAAPLPGPPEIPKVPLVPELRTIPVPRDRNVFNVQFVDTALHTARQGWHLGARFRIQVRATASDQDRGDPG